MPEANVNNSLITAISIIKDCDFLNPSSYGSLLRSSHRLVVLTLRQGTQPATSYNVINRYETSVDLPSKVMGTRETADLANK